MKLFKNILYVSEASVAQETSIARAVSLAENNQADLTVIDVVPVITAGIGMPPGGPISSELQAAMVSERRKVAGVPGRAVQNTSQYSARGTGRQNVS